MQVGDLGYGFIRHGSYRKGTYFPNPPHKKMVEAHAEFIRGNHDSPSVVRRQSQWIPDGTVRGNMMFVGGAKSTDRARRLEGYNWWPDEELSYQELFHMIDIYEAAKPEIMVTHDCPYQIDYHLAHATGKYYQNMDSRTKSALQSMFDLHKPRLWIFGHWHFDYDEVFDGTRFICLNELSWIDVNITTLEIVNRGSGQPPKKMRRR